MSATTRPSPRLSPAFVAVVLGLLFGLQAVTTDMMVPALPALVVDLGTTLSTAQLTMSGLILAFGVAQLFWGPVADRVGRRPVLLAGLAAYVAAAAFAAQADGAAQVVVGRFVQGAALAASVVCARAIVRDLYAPEEGSLVIARAMFYLGLLAIASPPTAGLLVDAGGWRLALAGMATFGVGVALFVWRALPETAPSRRRTQVVPPLGSDASTGTAAGGPVAVTAGVSAEPPTTLRAQLSTILRHPTFRAWTLLVASSYAAVFTFLVGAGQVLIRELGLRPSAAGAVVSAASVAYIGGTFLARRWIPRGGPVAAVQRGAAFSALGALCAVAGLVADTRSALWVMLPICVHNIGHGAHNACGQAGAVSPFPRMAGTAAALAGFALALVAFAVGLWLGRVLGGGVRPYLATLAFFTATTAAVAWTVVRRLPR